MFWKEWELDDYIRATNDGFKDKCHCRVMEAQIANLIKQWRLDLTGEQLNMWKKVCDRINMYYSLYKFSHVS
jgi:hypothetical protein